LSLGMPYMGSKRKLAKPIIDFILKQNPNTKYIYDLFGGGGSISFEALQRKQIKKVLYNELNTGVVELLKDIKENGVTRKYYNWIDRDTFNKHKDDNDWFGGLCKCIWSFGNNQNSYLFGKEIEEDKRLLYEIVVNKCKKSLAIVNKKFDLNIKLNPDKTLFTVKESINDRRLRIMSQIKKTIGCFKLQQLQQLQHQ